jgi:hypothetical protein
MPMISGGHKALVRYPDGRSAVITLHALPLVGQVIAHGWEVASVAPGEGEVQGVRVEYEVSVVRPGAPSPGPDSPSAFIVTRIQVGEYETWRQMFDQDRPRAREKAKAQRVFRGVDDPNQVVILLEFASVEDADEARRRIVESGVLDRFEDKQGPDIVHETPA